MAARIRALAFFATSVLISLPLFVVMVAIYPLVMLFDRHRYVVSVCMDTRRTQHRRQAEHVVNFVWAKLSMLFFNPVEVLRY